MKIINTTLKIILICFCLLFVALMLISVEKIINTDYNILVRYCKNNSIYNYDIDYRHIVSVGKKASKIFKIDRYLIFSVIIAESECNYKAIHNNYYTNNRTGEIKHTVDKGLMQINTIWNDIVFDKCDYDMMFDIENNIYAGTYILKSYWDKYNGDLIKTVWSYNGLTKNNFYYPTKILKIYGELNLMR